MLMKRLLLFVMLAALFSMTSYSSPVEKGDVLKISLLTEDMQVIVTNADYNIPQEPGYIISLSEAYKVFAEGTQGVNVNYEQSWQVNNRQSWQKTTILTYKNERYYTGIYDNFIRWL